MQWPVKNRTEEEMSLSYYDNKASNEDKQAAMVEYENTFSPHMGIDLARQDNQSFDVVAALSGKVTAVDKNPIVGNLVEVTSANGMVTVYQSLSDVTVTKDSEVKQGDVIAKAGRNELEKDEGVHLHFEVRQAGAPVNPQQFLAKQ
jgi:stage II sporulation protein Q